MIVDFRSDTVTKPSKEMLEAMFSAELGDDVFEEDPTVIALEQKAAKIFGKEAGIFCPSGTMTNQIAVRLHTQIGSEVICDRLCHIYNYEGGGVAVNSGASVRLMHGDRGRFTAEMVEENINPDDVHAPVTSMVAVEDTCNKGGGSVYNLEELREIAKVCRANKLAFHLDGARVFNGLVESGNDYKDYGSLFDTISICLSKGLGTPSGSVLLGTRENIKMARRVRKVLGGGMRQAGILAAAGIYALDHNVNRLQEDHAKARQLAETLAEMTYIKEVVPVETNIVIVHLADGVSNSHFIGNLANKGIKVVPFGPGKIRFVTHLDIDDSSMQYTLEVLKNLD